MAVISVATMGWLSRARLVTPDSNAGTAALLTAVVLPVLVALLTAFVARDFMLRRRLRSVINDQGKCASSGYLAHRAERHRLHHQQSDPSQVRTRFTPTPPGCSP
ncbi:MAG TPA: hypothetical protein VEB22_00320, partial [Phycisphaerales bacterium]|nr:hypothetical protein [Phycisphaerales bacterium]